MCKIIVYTCHKQNMATRLTADVMIMTSFGLWKSGRVAYCHRILHLKFCCCLSYSIVIKLSPYSCCYLPFPMFCRRVEIYFQILPPPTPLSSSPQHHYPNHLPALCYPFLPPTSSLHYTSMEECRNDFLGKQIVAGVGLLGKIMATLCLPL